MSGRERLCPGRQSKIWPVQIIVWLPGHFRSYMEILCRRRRIRRPLEAGGWPGVLPSNLAVAHGQGEISHREQIAQRENRCARRGQHVEHLKFRRIGVIAARHAEIAKDELRKEREVEANEQGDGRGARKSLRIEPAGNLRPPQVQSNAVTQDRSADHNVVEMVDHEVGVVNVNVQAQAGEEESGEDADKDEAEETGGY